MDILHNGALIPDATPTGGPGVTAVDLKDGGGIVWAPTRVAGIVALVATPSPGDRVAAGIISTPVSTAGTTFATGADLLTAALSFTATGTTRYVVGVWSPSWHNTAVSINSLRVNIDGSDAGIITQLTTPGNEYTPCVGVASIIPSAGSHSLNIRLVVSAGTGTVEAGVGGAGAFLPAIVTIDVQ